MLYSFKKKISERKLVYLVSIKLNFLKLYIFFILRDNRANFEKKIEQRVL